MIDHPRPGFGAVHADQQLRQTSEDYDALDTEALALCGLALTTDPAKAAQAATVFRAARTITSADGIVGQAPRTVQRPGRRRPRRHPHRNPPRAQRRHS